MQSPLNTPNWESLSVENEEEVHLEDEEVILNLGNDSVVVKEEAVEM